ncbi:MAG: hypothetical protein QM669_06260 [Siphonobacter sp.]
MKSILSVLALGLIGGLFYCVLRNSEKDVSDQKPYVNLLNRPLYLQTKVALAKNLPEFSEKEEYFVTEEPQLFEGVKGIAILPKGAKLIFEKAFHIHHGVSGVNYSILTGKVWIESLQKELPFEYKWGQYHDICLEEPCHYWTFPKALWQSQVDEQMYVIE